MRLREIRKAWADQLGEPSDLIVELHVEASQPGSMDAPCSVRGRISVPSLPRNDDEMYCLAQVLVDQTTLPLLRTHWNLRILDIAIKHVRTYVRTLEIDGNGLSMPRFMFWEQEYIENPYLRALPMKHLNQRFFDIMVNLHNITNAGKLGIQISAGSVEWTKYFHHVTTEARTRELPYPLFLDTRQSPNWSKDAFVSSVKGNHSARAAQAVRKWKQSQDRGFNVMKYGEYRFMKALLERGEVQISPSRTFNDEFQNQALRDDENSMTAFGARTCDGEVVPAHDIPDWCGDRYTMLEFTASMDRDYLLYCLAGTLSPTLFSHFGEDYDACIVIHDIGAFASRLKEATRACFPPIKYELAAGTSQLRGPHGGASPRHPRYQWRRVCPSHF